MTGVRRTEPFEQPSLFSLSGADIDRAAKRIAPPVVTPTSLQIPATLSAITGATVYLKREDLQTVPMLRGSVQLRWVQLSGGGTAGVVCSSGNHAQGFAYACRCLGARPGLRTRQTPKAVARDRIRYHGGEFNDLIVETGDLAAAAALRCGTHRATLVPLFDLAHHRRPGIDSRRSAWPARGRADLVVVPVRAAASRSPPTWPSDDHRGAASSWPVRPPYGRARAGRAGDAGPCRTSSSTAPRVNRRHADLCRAGCRRHGFAYHRRRGWCTAMLDSYQNEGIIVYRRCPVGRRSVGSRRARPLWCA